MMPYAVVEIPVLGQGPVLLGSEQMWRKQA